MIFKYHEVFSKITSPTQKRGFYTATIKQSENFFARESLLFLDGEKHATWRQLLEEVKFARSPIDLDLVRTIPFGIPATEPAHLPVLMKAIFGADMTADAAEAL